MNIYNSKKTIRLLVVDEQSSFFDLISEQAEFCPSDVSFECKYTGSGKEAIKLLTSWGPSVVLLNVHIPDINSFDIVSRCKESFTQVIVTSDVNSPEIEETARQKGACAYVVKSDDPDDVECLVSEISQFSPGVEAHH